MDLVIAARFGVDPLVVTETWPVGLRQRAVAWIRVESIRAERRT